MSPYQFYLIVKYSPCIIWLGLAFLYIRPLRLGFWPSGGLLALLTAVLAKSFWYQALGGHRFYPDFPKAVCITTEIAFCFCIILFVLSLLPPYRRGGRKCALVKALLAAAITAYGAYEGLRIPEVRAHEIAVSGLPPAFDGMRLVQISDLHCGPGARRDYVQGVVNRVNAVKPDLICFTGDLVDGSHALRAGDLAPLAELKAKWGKYGCMGNHECYSLYWHWRPIFTRLGIQMLDNAHVVITNGNDILVLGGVTDKNAGRYFMDGITGKKPTDRDGNKRPRWPTTDIQAAFSNAPPNSCRILLEHRPIDTLTNGLNGVKLQLSGHTHGAPIWGAGWLIESMNEGHSSGLYEEHGLKLYVTPGAGLWVGFPLRLSKPSEIAELTLRAAP